MELAIAIHPSYFFSPRRRKPSSLSPFSISNNTRRIGRIVATVTIRAEAAAAAEEEEEEEEEKGSEKSDSASASTSATTSSSERGLGFGSSSARSSYSSRKDGKKKRNRQRANIIRRSPIEKPSFLADSQPKQQQSANENAFLLTWLGLGFLILIEGIALAASGFLPEEWDKFFVKYLYPSFTPTVFVFVGGTVGYGVLKYLQSEQGKS